MRTASVGVDESWITEFPYTVVISKNTVTPLNLNKSIMTLKFS